MLSAAADSAERSIWRPRHLHHLVDRLHFGSGGREMFRAALTVRTRRHVDGHGVKVGHRNPGPTSRQRASPPALLLAASRSS